VGCGGFWILLTVVTPRQIFPRFFHPYWTGLPPMAVIAMIKKVHTEFMAENANK